MIPCETPPLLVAILPVACGLHGAVGLLPEWVALMPKHNNGPALLPAAFACLPQLFLLSLVFRAWRGKNWRTTDGSKM